MVIAFSPRLNLVLKPDNHVILALDILNQNVTLILQLFDLLDSLQQVAIVISGVYLRGDVQGLLQETH